MALTHGRAVCNSNTTPNPIKSSRAACYFNSPVTMRLFSGSVLCGKRNNPMRKKALPVMTGTSAAAKRAYKRRTICSQEGGGNGC
jgi:hypothetical protein